jgi:hypothetical protein
MPMVTGDIKKDGKIWMAKLNNAPSARGRLLTVSQKCSRMSILWYHFQKI